MASDLGTARPEHAGPEDPPPPPTGSGEAGVTDGATVTTGTEVADGTEVMVEEVIVEADPTPRAIESRRLPRWTIAATAVFWGGFLAVLIVQFFWGRLNGLFVLLAISVFLALAIEPGVNRLARRGWRRGTATALVLFGVVAIFLVFVVAIGALVGTQIAELLANSEAYISDTVNTINETFGTNLNAQEVIDQFNDPNGAVQQFIADQQDNVVSLSGAVLGGLLQLLSVMLFTFYLVADGPKMRRAICSRFTPARQERLLATWELAGNKTGGYLYSRALLALLSAVFHWIVFQAVGTPAPVALALWVGIISQFLPVVGTYLAGVLPVLLTFLESPVDAIIVLIAIVVYQQIENYLFSPRITARTMELHPALAFGSALAGAAILGGVGAVLALPAAAMAQALVSDWGDRHQVVKSDLTEVDHPRVWKRWAKIRKAPR
ncbi:MAG: AI-2E family transporter [Ilumatobacteraceae bacterium]